MRRRTLLVAAAAVLTVAGCSSSGGGHPTANGDLAAALSQLDDTPGNRALVEFGRTKAAVTANGGLDYSGAYLRSIGLGANRLFPSYRSLAKATGIDLTTATYAVTAGQPPKAGVLLSGLELGDTGPRLEALGAKRSGHGSSSVYRFRADNAYATDDKLASAVPGIVNALNVVEIDGTKVRVGASAAAVDQTRAKGPGLLGNAEFRDAASCLGDPLAAYLTGRVPSGSSAAGVRVIGVGLTGAKGETPTDLMCTRLASTADAKALAKKVDAAVSTGESRQSRRKWSDLLTGATVSVDGRTVKLSAHPAGGRPGGTLMTSFLIQDLPGLT